MTDMTSEQEAIERLRWDAEQVQHKYVTPAKTADLRALLDSLKEVTEQRDYLMDGVLGMAALEKHTCPDVCYRCDLSSLARASHERGVPRRPIEALLDRHERIGRVLAVLRDVEWLPIEDIEVGFGQERGCPVCKARWAWEPVQHAGGCALAEAIASLEGVL